MIRSLFIVLLTVTVGQVVAVESETTRQLDFEVFLNDREVGRHQFELLEQGDSIQVSSTMTLDFKVLRIKRIQYSHQAK